MSTIREIDDAINVLYKSGLKKKNLVLMQCNSAYPTPLKDLNLNVLENFKKNIRRLDFPITLRELLHLL